MRNKEYKILSQLNQRSFQPLVRLTLISILSKSKIFMKSKITLIAVNTFDINSSSNVLGAIPKCEATNVPIGSTWNHRTLIHCNSDNSFQLYQYNIWSLFCPKK